MSHSANTGIRHKTLGIQYNVYIVSFNYVAFTESDMQQ